MNEPRSTVALFLLNQNNDYQADMGRAAVEAAARQGLTLELHGAEGRSERQHQQIESVLRGPGCARVAALLVHPVYDGVHEDLAREAARAGLGWVLLNREADYIADLRGTFPRLPLFSVTPDQTEIGRVQGQAARALLPRGGRVLLVSGPEGASSARLRRAGLEEAVQGAGIQIVRIAAEYTVEGGDFAAREWERRMTGQSHPVFRSFLPDVVVAHNDVMATGARRALAEIAHRRGWPHLARTPIVGCDGTRQLGVRLVEEGTLTATVVVPGTAASAVELVAEHRRHGRPPEGRVRLPVSLFPDAAALHPRAD